MLRNTDGNKSPGTFACSPLVCYQLDMATKRTDGGRPPVLDAVSEASKLAQRDLAPLIKYASGTVKAKGRGHAKAKVVAKTKPSGRR